MSSNRLQLLALLVCSKISIFRILANCNQLTWEWYVLEQAHSACGRYRQTITLLRISAGTFSRELYIYNRIIDLAVVLATLVQAGPVSDIRCTPSHVNDKMGTSSYATGRSFNLRLNFCIAKLRVNMSMYAAMENCEVTQKKTLAYTSRDNC